MEFTREIKGRILNLSSTFPAVVLTGARQTGKTTLLKALFPDHGYVNLDLPSEAEKAEKAPEQFLRDHPPPLLIDEVQYAPGLFRHLKIEIDREREIKGRFILTGSQKFTLMKGVSESLAGRAGILELEGLSCQELGKVHAEYLKENDAGFILARGFFPELWKDASIVSAEFYRSYIATYLERDLRQLLNVGSLRDFERFMRACAVRSGQLLNKTDLGRDVGITQKTVEQWLSVLVASNQLTLLEPYFGNVGKRLIKSPRLFFNDTGLLCFLLGLDGANVSAYSGIGAIWETFVCGELRKLREFYAPEAVLWFYRDDRAREIDFILDRGGKLTLLEAKWIEIPDKRAARSMLEIADDLDRPIAGSYLACRTPGSFPLEGGVRAVSAYNLAPLFYSHIQRH